MHSIYESIFSMALANLFSPNDYDLFCHSITASGSGGTGNLIANSIDTINIGDPMTIGAVKAGSVAIGSVASGVRLNGNVIVPNEFFCNSIAANTLSGMTIGTNATALNLIPNTGDITIDDATITANTIRIGDFGCSSVTISKIGGQTLIKSPLQLSNVGSSLTSYDELATISGTGSGCIPNTANYIQFRAIKINSIVILSWRVLAAPVNATAAASLTIIETLPATFTPAVSRSSSTLVLGSSVAPLPVIAGTQLPGFITISLAGAISFGFAPATHGSTSSWVIGEPAQAVSGSMSYSVLA